ncbi:MAG: biotin--[acetyl-CoA-carboxylase] ligase [Brevinematia bacterium]
MRGNKKDGIISLLMSKDFVSGEQISRSLGISRVMVNRYVRMLRNEGFDIEIRKGRGYRLNNVPDVIYPSLISFKSSVLSGYKFVIFDSLPSTNSFCLENASKLSHKTVVIANDQTKGRGRMERIWISEKGKDLTMSIFLKPGIYADEVIKYSISASLAVFDTLRDFDIDNVFIKWPNDIMYENKKICGILTETTIQYDTKLVENLVIGIGLNVNSSPGSRIQNAISMFDVLGFEIKRSVIVGKIVEAFDKYVSLSYGEVFERWRSNMGFIGKVVLIKFGDEELLCRFIDVSKSGEIIVEKDNEIKKFGFGEVSLVLG